LEFGSELVGQRRRRSIRLAGGTVIRLPAVMGVLNVTPDSFSDGGRYLDPDRAITHALAMQDAGAAIIDIGGESTRPSGAREVSAEAEIGRVAPVLEGLKGRLRVPISIDTRRSKVARLALDCGAAIINDVSALASDPAMARLAAERRCAVVLMHMRGGPADHMKFARYHDVIHEVAGYLSRRAAFAVRSGVSPSRIILDPGLGFSKRPHHSLLLLGALPQFCGLGYPILIGASRKGFVRRTAGTDSATIEFATAAANAIAIANGAAIVRVHEVAAAVAVAKMAAAIISCDGR
jgi:dihydropteroate synthase